MGDAPRAVSLEDVAKAAGVGKATASRALSSRGGLDVNAATRARVRAIADGLGYSPNRAAQSLRTGRHHALALVAPIRDWAWWAPVVNGASAAAAAAGHHLVVEPAEPDVDLTDVVARLTDASVDGVIIMADRPVTDAFVVPSGLEVVLIDDVTASPRLTTVRGGNDDGGYALAAHLAGRGYTRPVIVHSATDAAYERDRIAGFRRAFAERGIEIPDDRLIVTGESLDPQSASPKAIAGDLAQHDPFDCVFAVADYLAATVLRSLRLLGRAVPDQVGVVGYDDERIAALLDPPLTTFHQPLDKMGAAAVEAVLARIAGADPAPTVTLEGHLVVRGSA